MRHGGKDGIDGLELGQPGGDLEQVHERGPVTSGRGPSSVDRERDVRGHRREHLQLLLAGQGLRFAVVERENPEQRTVGASQRCEQDIAGRRNVDEAELAPAELSVGDERDTAVLEPIVEQRRPRVERRCRVEQALPNLVASVGGHDLEGVAARPVEMDDDGAETETLGQDLRSPPEENVRLLLEALNPE